MGEEGELVEVKETEDRRVNICQSPDHDVACRARTYCPAAGARDDAPRTAKREAATVRGSLSGRRERRGCLKVDFRDRGRSEDTIRYNKAS